MYAIIQTGGKQYKVEKGMKLNVEKLPNDVGSEVEFSQVLLVRGDESGAQIGQPYLAESKVLGRVVDKFRNEKVLIFKKRPKKGYKKMQGHRQNLTQVEIKEIVTTK